MWGAPVYVAIDANYQLSLKYMVACKMQVLGTGLAY
jgi:hypothetical protein